MATFTPGVQSAVYPEAPRGLLIPGDAGIPQGIAPACRRAIMPRLGLAENPDGRGLTSIRAGYGIFFDELSNGMGLGGPALANVDMSLLKPFPLSERLHLQFPAEVFNVANHANFAVPVSDLNSANFGRVLEAGPARLVQFGLKLLF